MGKENIEEYAVCDFCHTAKPAKELENIKVIFKKCKDCKIGNLEGLKPGVVVADKSAGIERKKGPGEGHPPAFLREAFRPPDQSVPKLEVKVEPKVEVKKEDDGANKSTTVQSPESGKSS